MLLTLDIGNTNITIGLFELKGQSLASYKEFLKGTSRLETNKRKTSDEYLFDINNFLLLNGKKLTDISDIIISSVVTELNYNFSNLAKKISSNINVIFIHEDYSKWPLDIKIDNPKELGADRFANSFAAIYGELSRQNKKDKKTKVIIDLGTATTFDVISPENQYIGGYITPGINLSIDALARSTSKLPNVSMFSDSITAVAEGQKIPSNTVSAMRQGVYWGYLGMIERLCEEIYKHTTHKKIPSKEIMAKEIDFIATGGLAKYFSISPFIKNIMPDLTLEGLWLMANMSVVK